MALFSATGHLLAMATNPTACCYRRHVVLIFGLANKMSKHMCIRRAIAREGSSGSGRQLASTDSSG